VAISRELDLERTSIWTFAKRGTDRYSSVTRDNFIGFGPSATSLLSDRFTLNTFSLTAYIEAIRKGRLPVALALRFTPRTRALYWLFWSAYSMHIRRQDFHFLFHQELEHVFGTALRLARQGGLVRADAEGWHLTSRGAKVFHMVEQKYTHQYIDKTWHIAMENPWPRRIALY